MAQYIDKSALVAEIERRLKLVIGMSKSGVGFTKNNPVLEFAISEYKDFLSFLDTLEVKEMNLEKDVESYWKQCDLSWCIDAYNMTHVRSMLSDIAKHFFELGLKAQKGE